MIKFDITHDINKAIKSLGAFAKQVPYATSVALNKTAADIQKVERAAMQRELDNPRPSTIKGIRTQRSTKRKLIASVFVLSHIDKFLKYQVEGGVRRPSGKAEAVPVNIKLNKYGNIIGRRRGKIAKLIARKDTFVGTVRGVPGVYQRSKKGNKLSLLVAFEKSVQYAKRFDFYKHANRTANKRWAKNFNKAIATALKTAR